MARKATSAATSPQRKRSLNSMHSKIAIGSVIQTLAACRSPCPSRTRSSATRRSNSRRFTSRNRSVAPRAEFQQATILLTGLAGLLAGAISMALGEWLSVQSSRELYQAPVWRSFRAGGDPGRGAGGAGAHLPGQGAGAGRGASARGGSDLRACDGARHAGPQGAADRPGRAGWLGLGGSRDLVLAVRRGSPRARPAPSG